MRRKTFEQKRQEREELLQQARQTLEQLTRKQLRRFLGSYRDQQPPTSGEEQ